MQVSGRRAFLVSVVGLAGVCAGCSPGTLAYFLMPEPKCPPELKQIVRSLFRDPRSGDVEFQLTNINRREPPADLFQVPADYTIVGGGERGGGGRGGPRLAAFLCGVPGCRAG